VVWIPFGSQGRFRRGTLTTEDTEKHRDSQRKAEKREEGVAGGNLRVVRRKQGLIDRGGLRRRRSGLASLSLLFSVNLRASLCPLWLRFLSGAAQT
jgi:hypothetical protein